MPFIRECLQTSPSSYIAVLEDGCFVAGVGFGIDPDFYFEDAGAVVEAVGYVCGLLRDVADLAYDCDLRYGRVVDLEVGVVGRFGFEELLDGYRS